MKKLQKIHIEISNICNLQCTFCPEVEREKKIMDVSTFSKVLAQAIPLTERVCLHLMGEPMAHPEFTAIIAECERQNARIELTTNGTLLAKYPSSLLLSKCLVQINFSLHSFKDNFPTQDIRPYLFDILMWSKEAMEQRPDLYINYRLWNLPGPTATREENYDIIETVAGFFHMSVDEKVDVGRNKSKNITGRIYFHFDTRFEWPNPQSPKHGDRGFCHALSGHIGIHAEGIVVPCCLDKEANLPLGTIHQQALTQILGGERAEKMKTGFKNRQLTEDLCQRCTYIQRFN